MKELMDYIMVPF